MSLINVKASYCFNNCTGLNYITIPDAVQSVNEYAFYNCENLEKIEIGSGVNKIGKQAFAYCSSLESITLPEGITELPDFVLSFCSSLSELIIPNGVISIGSNAVYACSNLCDVTIPNSVKSIGTNAFWGCESLTSVTIPDSVTTIGERAFSVCKNLNSVKIGNGVTTIKPYTFSDCTNLASVYVSNSVTSIGDRAFFYCNSLTDVYYTGTEDRWNEISIGKYNGSLPSATVHFINDEHTCSFGEWIVAIEPDCINTGIEKRECSCGKYETRTIQPNGIHQYSARKGEDPTCIKEGFIEYCCDICENSRYTETILAKGHNFIDGYCEYCGEPESNVPDEPEYNYLFGIQTPSRTKIRNKDGIVLRANVEGNAPEGSYVKWESSNGYFDTSADSSNLKVIAKNKGYTTFTAILCDADGNELARDSVEMYSKSGFFDKIGGFFRSLFGTTKIYDN